MSQLPGQVHYHHDSSRLTSKSTCSYFSINHVGLISPQRFLLRVLYLLQILIPPCLRKILKFIVFALLENPFESQKIESRSFYLSFQIKFYLRGFIITPSKQSGITYPPGSVFSKIYSPSRIAAIHQTSIVTFNVLYLMLFIFDKIPNRKNASKSE